MITAISECFIEMIFLLDFYRILKVDILTDFYFIQILILFFNFIYWLTNMFL